MQWVRALLAIALGLIALRPARAALMLPDFDRADAIGLHWTNPKTRTFAELLIDCEKDRTLRAVLVLMPREAERSIPRSTRGRSPAE